MLFIVIILVFIFIALITIFGDYTTKEMNKDYQYYNRIVGK